jgi:hypothetical protein
MSLAAKEARLRRVARSVGIILQKSHSRTPEDPSFGGYMLVDARTNSVVEGARDHAFDLTIDEVEYWLEPAEDRAVMGRARDGTWAI